MLLRVGHRRFTDNLRKCPKDRLSDRPRGPMILLSDRQNLLRISPTNNELSAKQWQNNQYVDCGHIKEEEEEEHRDSRAKLFTSTQ